MNLIIGYVVITIVALIHFYFIRKNPTLLNFRHLFWINLVYCALFLLVGHYFSIKTDLITLYMSLFLIFFPLILKNKYVMFNFSEQLFEIATADTSRRLLLKNEIVNTYTRIITTKEAKVIVSVHMLFPRIGVIKYTGKNKGQKIRLYKSLFSKSFHSVFPTLKIN